MTSPGVNDQASEQIDLAQLLGMEVEADGLLVGRRSGFPVGLKVTAANGALILVFHARHLSPAKSDQVKGIRHGDAIRELIDAKKLDVDFDDSVAWFTFLDASAQLQDGSLPALVDEILGEFAGAGLGGNDGLCHYCRRNQVDKLSSNLGKVAQICPACLTEKQADFNRTASKVTDGAVSIAILAPVSAMAGAIGWAGCWIGYELIFENSGRGVIVVPRIAEVAAVVTVALLTGGPVGLIFMLVRRRGQALSVALSIVCSICAIVVGEVLLAAWLIYHYFKVFSLDAAWHILPRLEAEMGVFYFALKLMSAVIAVVLAAQIAKPHRRNLKL